MPLNSPMGQKFIKRMIDILLAEKQPSDMRQKALFHQTLGKIFGQKASDKATRRKP
jgi:hypothetical protein